MKTDKNENQDKPGFFYSAIFGALTLGPLYAVGVSGLAYGILSVLLVSPPSFTTVLLYSLPICMAVGALGDFLLERLVREKSAKAAKNKTPEKQLTIHRSKTPRRPQKAA